MMGRVALLTALVPDRLTAAQRRDLMEFIGDRYAEDQRAKMGGHIIKKPPKVVVQLGAVPNFCASF